MLLNTLRAEFTKLVTTRSFWWTTGLFLFIAWGWSYLSARLSSDGGGLTSSIITMPIFLIGLPILMIQAIMVVTTEYRFGVQTPTYMANPNRAMVSVVKLVMYTVIATVLMLVGIAGGYLLAQLGAEDFSPWGDDDSRRFLWAYPAVTALSVVFCQGLALLLRQTAGTVAIVFILHLGLDQLIAFVPKVGDKIVHFSPFGALQKWATNFPATDAPWGDSTTGYLWVAIAWCAILWGLGLVALLKRDA